MASGLTPGGGPSRRLRRALAWCLVLAVVLATHGWLTDRLADATLGWGAADRAPARMEVAFVKELQPTAPPVRVARMQPPRHRAARHAAGSASGASAPRVAAAVPEPAPSAPEPVASASEMPASAPDTALAAAEPVTASAPQDAASAPAPAASGPAAGFEWPPSTRLSYTLTGNVQGPVEGWARVQWIRQGRHYQVQMDTRVALIASRKMTSDGELTDQGLRPLRYDEETDVLVGTPRRASVRFEEDRVVLNTGQVVARPEGVQDTASQLVQLVWLFTTRPELLQPGRTVELPLALPWRLDTWVFDVLAPEPVLTAFGEVPTLHVKPRPPERPGNVLLVECWFAPTLQYLPVRIRIQQKADVWLDLLLDKPPLQAAP
jgi:hypothetical protein